MIKSLRIRNLATIEDIELNFVEGFSILTGETGAGKSIIIDGLRLALGEKGSADMIRTGKTETSVEAIFTHPQEDVGASGLFSDKEDIFVQRRISEQGAGRGYVNGTLVPIQRLKDISETLVDIFGQNDHIFLRRPDHQLDYLDHFANAVPLRNTLAQTAQELRKLDRQKQDLVAKEREREIRLDFLGFQIEEIEKAGLSPQEEEELRQEREILKNMERINAAVKEGLNISCEEDNSLTPMLARLQKVVGRLSDYDEFFKDCESSISQFSISLKELADFLLDFREKYTDSPERLDQIEERLSLIEKLKRKYGGTVAEVLDYLDRARKEYDELGASQARLEDLDRAISRSFEDYKSLADELHLLRMKHAQDLEKRIKEEIARLGMKKAVFKIDLQHQSPNPEHPDRCRDKGTEEVDFLISPNPGEDPKPMRKIASGGELSRIMLALKSVGKETERMKTLIFDEIDAGIGGRTAEFVAQKLKALSQNNQVICITHLPQIASFAVSHYRIAKKVEKDRTYTTVKKLAREERVHEIAQLLAGSHVTETALRNAREMLERNLGTSETL